MQIRRSVMAAFALFACASALPAQGATPMGNLEMNRPRIVDTQSAEHYTWGDANDGWYFVKRDDLSVIRERIVPGGAEVPHFHRTSRQFFQVLSGTLTMRIDGTDYDVHAGQGIEIAPGVKHQALNSMKAPVEMLVISMPNSHGDRVESSKADAQH